MDQMARHDLRLLSLFIEESTVLRQIGLLDVHGVLRILLDGVGHLVGNNGHERERDGDQDPATKHGRERKMSIS